MAAQSRADQAYATLLEAQKIASSGDAKGALKQCLKALALDPKSAGAYDLKSTLEFRLGLKARSLESLRKAMTLGAPSAGRLATAARLLQGLGELEEAAARCREAAQLEPGRAEHHELLASLLTDLGDGEAALESLMRALELAPAAALHLKAASLLLERDRHPEAVDQLRKAIEHEPSLVRAHELLWSALLGLGKRAEAVASAVAAPRDPKILSAAAAFCRDAEEFEAAEKLYEAAGAADEAARLRLWQGDPSKARASGDPALRGAAAALEGRLEEARRELYEAREEPETLIWRGEVLRRLGRHKDARRELNAACKGIHPAQWPLAAQLNLRLLDIAEGKPLDEALDARISELVAWRQLGFPRTTRPIPAERLEYVLECMRGHRGSPHTLVWKDSEGQSSRPIHYNPRVTTMGLQAALRFGEPDRLLAEFDALIARFPTGIYLQESRGELCLWLGRCDEAERFIKRGLELNPGLPWPNIGLCGVQALRGDLKGALAFLEKAAANGAPDRVLAVWRGELYRKLGDPERALAEFDKATEKPPFRLSLWLNRALAQEAAGKAREARATRAMLERHVAPFLADAGGSLETALEMMKGNRSSWMYTYVDRVGRVRHVKLRDVPARNVPAERANDRWMFA